MKRNSSLIVLFVMLVSLSSFSVAEARPRITLSPARVGPGDLMVATVTRATGTVEGTFDGKPVFFVAVKNAYKAIIGIDLKAEPGKYPLELTVNGKRFSRTVRVRKKMYPVQRLTLPKDKVELSPEDEARVEREQKELAAVWPVASPRLWNGNFLDPLPGKEITTRFGLNRIINDIPKNPHTGVDLAAEAGEPVRAPNDGIAVVVEEQFFSGNSVILDHGQGIYTMFFHLSQASVRQGQTVHKGDIIGLTGATGRVTGPCLHWGTRIMGARVDPLELVHLKLE